MKRVAIVLLLLLSGCATATVQTDTDGNCKASYSSFFKGMDSATLEACGGRGEVVKSQNDPILQVFSELLKDAQ